MLVEEFRLDVEVPLCKPRLQDIGIAPLRDDHVLSLERLKSCFGGFDTPLVINSAVPAFLGTETSTITVAHCGAAVYGVRS